MAAPDRVHADKLFARYRSRRAGIRKEPALAQVCLICGSTHIGPKHNDVHQMICFSCGFAFFRYECPACGATVDGRDPENPGCHECGLRTCTCGACGCHSD